MKIANNEAKKIGKFKISKNIKYQTISRIKLKLLSYHRQF